jgi:hypothetical protein
MADEQHSEAAMAACTSTTLVIWRSLGSRTGRTCRRWSPAEAYMQTELNLPLISVVLSMDERADEYDVRWRISAVEIIPVSVDVLSA